jgi:hypothetical protein
MAAQGKIQQTMCSLNTMKKRDRWEKQVRIAYAQLESMKANCRIYENESTRIIERYEKWLLDNKCFPLIDINYYKSLP